MIPGTTRTRKRKKSAAAKKRTRTNEPATCAGAPVRRRGLQRLPDPARAGAMAEPDALTDWILANPTISTLVGLGLLGVAWLWVHLGTRGEPPGKVGKPLPAVRTEGYRPDGAVFIPLELG